MGRNFNGSSAYLELPSAVVAAEPLTMACWCLPLSSITSGVVLSIDTGAGTSRWQINTNTTGFAVLAQAVNSAGTAGQSTVGAANSGAWKHVAGVFSSSTSRTAYENGIAGTVDTTAITVSGVNKTQIGARISAGAVGVFFCGLISDAAIWNTALTANEIAGLSRGVRPDQIRRESLVFYNPLDDRWTYERKCGLIMSDVGPTGAAEDPPFLQRPIRKYFLFGSTASAASIFRNRTGSRSRFIA